jgi:hypothetical protein
MKKGKNFYKMISPNSIDVRIQITHVLSPVGEDGVIVVDVQFLHSKTTIISYLGPSLKGYCHKHFSSNHQQDE